MEMILTFANDETKTLITDISRIYFLNEDEFTIICRYNRASGKLKNVITELSRNNHRLKHLKINCKNSTLIDVDVEQYMYILKFIEETQLFEERFLLRKVL